MVNTMVTIWLMMIFIYSNDWLVVEPPTPLKHDGLRWDFIIILLIILLIICGKHILFFLTFSWWFGNVLNI